DEPGLDLRVSAVMLNDDPDEVGALLLEDGCTIGLSDAGAHVGQLCDAPYATDLLGNWVRDRSLMPIEQAIRKLTGLQADLFGLDEQERPGVVMRPAARSAAPASGHPA